MREGPSPASCVEVEVPARQDLVSGFSANITVKQKL